MEKKMLELWKLQYHIHERSRLVARNAVMHLTFFYVEDAREARERANEFIRNHDQEIIEDKLEPCPYGFQLNHSALPARLPAKQELPSS